MTYTYICRALVKSILIAVFSVLFLAQPSRGAFQDILTTQEIQGTLENTKLNEVFGQYLATILMYDPERATFLGLHDSDYLLTERNAKTLNFELRAFKKLRSNLSKIKKDVLYKNLQIDYDLLDHMLEVDIYNIERLDKLKTRPQYYLEPLFAIYELLTKDFDDYNIRASNALKRMKQFPEILLEAESNISHPPKIWVEQTIVQINDAIDNIYEFHPLFRRYTRYDPLSKDRLNRAIENARNSLKRYKSFLQVEILPNADGDFRTGPFTYGFYLERWHGLDKTPGSMRRYAKKSFKRSLKEFKAEARHIDPIIYKAKGWNAVLEKLPKEHPGLKNLVTAFQNELERSYQHFDEFKVVQFPKQRLLIKKMPGFLKSVKPYVYYQPPFALDDLRVAELYINIPPKKTPKPALKNILANSFNYTLIELLVSYSLMPGLHLQSYEAFHNPSRIRMISDQPFIINGWACYSELLAQEMGFYSSYWVSFMRAYIKLLRSGRAFVDASLHQKKMDYSEAVNFFKDELFFSEAQAKAEVVRISNTPTESLGYIYSVDAILDMRKYYKRAEEKYFDLRDFHTKFLREGSIPMSQIRSELKRKKKAAEKIIK
ncbi:MAG: DUF885 domain-containing protein [Elusimicrobiota bacterium]|nr:DUF885 domain-containing protein [Elusimicrobiota bacterium]